MGAPVISDVTKMAQVVTKRPEAVTDAEGFSDPIRRRWAAAYEAKPVGEGWAPEMVRRELQEAFKVLGVSVAAVRPRQFGNGMPAYFSDDLDLILDQAMPGWRSDPDEPERKRISTEQMTRMEAVILWPWRFVAEFETALRPHPGFVLNVWLRCPDRRSPFSRAVKAIGWSKETAKRRVNQALCLIALGLMEAGETPPAYLFDDLHEEPNVGGWAGALEAPPAPAGEPEPAWWPEILTLAQTEGVGAAVAAISVRSRDEFEFQPGFVTAWKRRDRALRDKLREQMT